MDLKSRYRGCLIGLAVGDALGTTLEFKPPGTFQPISDMIGGGPFCLEAGKWTDDTSMALCLAESLIEQQEFDPKDQMSRYVCWWREGYLSSTGSCFDIGNTVSSALAAFELDGNPYAGDDDPRAGGNGSLMRMAPIPLAYRFTPEMALSYSEKMSRTTHAAVEPVDACRFYTMLILGGLEGVGKEKLLDLEFTWKHFGPNNRGLTEKIARIAAGSYKELQPPKIRGTGYVVDSLEAALWAFFNSATFAEGALMAVNLGDDADTTGAIYGQLAGAYYGLDAIPRHWSSKISHSDLINTMADQLLDLSLRHPTTLQRAI